MIAALYLPIDTIAPAPGGAIGVTAFLREADAVEPAGLAGRAVSEMAAGEPVGDVIELRPLGKGLLLCARVMARLAVEKISAGVYKGFSVIVNRAGAVECVALVDHPDALGKRAGATAAAPLRFNLGQLNLGDTTMPTLDQAVAAVHAAMNAAPHRRAAVFDAVIASTSPGAFGKAAAPIGGVLINAAEVAEIERAERDRDEHRRRLAKREPHPAGPIDTPAVELFKASNLRPILPGFAFGHAER